MRIIDSFKSGATKALHTASSAIQAGGFLRGEVSFERWYFHYHNQLNPQQIATDPSISCFSRLWAIAYAIESFVKTIITFFSILYYQYQKNKPEVDKRVDVLYEQDNSLYYSFFAMYSPAKAASQFSVYNRKDPTQALTRTKLFGICLGKHSWGSPYTGNTTLKMLINTH